MISLQWDITIYSIKDEIKAPMTVGPCTKVKKVNRDVGCQIRSILCQPARAILQTQHFFFNYRENANKILSIRHELGSLSIRSVHV